MPYKSKDQRAYLHIHHPEIAEKWDKEYPKSAHSKTLPKDIDNMKNKEDGKWIQDAKIKKGTLTKAYPKLAKDGFSKKELDSIESNPKTSEKNKKRAQLAETFKKIRNDIPQQMKACNALMANLKNINK